MRKTITIDGQEIPYTEGQTIMDAAISADIYIPHLCHDPDYEPHGSCKLCTVSVNGRNCSACTFPAMEGQEIINHSVDLEQDRKRITQMLFVEGNHFCPSCEKTGNCQLQGIGCYLNMHDNHFPHFFANREMDASHPDILIDQNRCIFCNLYVRASQEKDRKNVFAISGRGINKHLIVNSISGQLKDSDIDIADHAVHICPTGAILIKRTGYQVPIGQRTYDHTKIDAVTLAKENKQHGR
ncbi:MAG TPA: 2Fe-2S iron-sulfur cluster binding domain-containing protein [Methyloprofundus sp.]|uniref:2Fe-2S iron-sulfur cluster-binding protein n=1 Tax=Methyloprofundus sp. TaxID=2020875 RepID=UPI00181E73F4|nr:2Fe-2S iron-sulfur cluster-binding protein [Methyloprofundus sp.]HIG64351.1 2Fe-2S iron-sulfur cluster binding domain-containing protein [Methyloprofundus sp.]